MDKSTYLCLKLKIRWENFLTTTVKLDNLLRDLIEERRVDWKQVSSGFGLTLGKLDDRPIYVCFSFAYINGHKICFYEATSQVIDHKLIEKWLKTQLN